MPPEHYQQRHPKETPTSSLHLQAVITDLAAYYEIDITQARARFSFTRPEQDKQWVIANLDGQHIDVARFPVETDDFMVPDLDIVLVMKPTGWQTVQVLHTDAVWEAFAKAAAENGQSAGNPQADFPFAAFTAYVAHLIALAIRLEQARAAEAMKAHLNFESGLFLFEVSAAVQLLPRDKHHPSHQRLRFLKGSGCPFFGLRSTARRCR